MISLFWGTAHQTSYFQVQNTQIISLFVGTTHQTSYFHVPNHQLISLFWGTTHQTSYFLECLQRSLSFVKVLPKMFFCHNLHLMAPFELIPAGFCTEFRRAPFWLTPKSLDFTPKSLDLTPRSLDFAPRPLDFTTRSLDLTPRSLDFAPRFWYPKRVHVFEVVPDGLVMGGLGMGEGGWWTGSYKGFACFGQGVSHILLIMG